MLNGLEVRGCQYEDKMGNQRFTVCLHYITKGIMIHYNGMFPQARECLQRRSTSNVCCKNGGKRPCPMRVCSYKEAAM
jgi:hypothetical protein